RLKARIGLALEKAGLQLHKGADVNWKSGKKLMRLTKIQVTKLFGVFDHTIPLNLADRITIIHGPNGFGKTAMLQMVQSLLGNRFARLRRVPFERFVINLEDGRELSVTRKFPSKTEAERDESAATLLFEL